MDEASQDSKNSKQASAVRYGVLMKHLHPEDPSKRFRNPVVSSGGSGPAIGGEDFFTSNSRRTS